MDDDINNIDWNKAQRDTVTRNDLKSIEPAPPRIDVEVSKIVGKNVLVTDPRLLAKVTKWKKDKDPNTPDNFLLDPNKRVELKKLLG